MKVRCLIVDDEPLAVRLIEKHLAQLEGFEIAAVCYNAPSAFEILSTQPIDLMFLDIKMPNITGIDFLKNLRNPPKTILTTAYRDFAIESYEIGVVDYLLKPITFERFLKAVAKFRETAPVRHIEKTADTHLIFKSGLKSYKVDTTHILYVESLKDYLKIHLANDSPIVFKYKIGDIEQDLRDRPFLRIHRSFLIGTDKITAFTNSEIEIKGVAVPLPVGASYKDAVVSFLETLPK